MNGLTPITVTSRIVAAPAGSLEPFGIVGAHLPLQQHGSQIGQNSPGVDDLGRIVFSLRSGIDSEVTWSLATLTRVSLNPNFSLEKLGFVGSELIRIFLAPYQKIGSESQDAAITTQLLSLSSDALLTLRNLAQDLSNQQWLSQVLGLKKELVNVLEFYSRLFSGQDNDLRHLQKFEDNWTENFTYLLDLLEPLTCYYIDNPKNDPLFKNLLEVCVSTKDKAVFVTTLNCLSHLMITRPQYQNHASSDFESSMADSTSEARLSNCIDGITEDHLEKITSLLLVNDNELNYAALKFLETYIKSPALHPRHPGSVRDSQYARIARLLQLKTSLANLYTLFKQLPSFALSGITLRVPSSLARISEPTLTRRSQFGGLPPSLPVLPPDLYAKILRLDEPLRATTWLRCCYEPYSFAASPSPTRLQGALDAMPGEVTQISLWKAYEKQFREVWELLQLPAHRAELKPLLAAVEFIKNVSLAFPNSEAMVVNLEPEGNDGPKRKFIIKGIQPRQFAVSIETGNYEALKPAPTVTGTEDEEERHLLPIGHIDKKKFMHQILAANTSIVAPEARITRKLAGVTNVNILGYEILDRIIAQCFERKDSAHLISIFRLCNKDRLTQIVYANPSLLDACLINCKWLRYLI